MGNNRLDVLLVAESDHFLPANGEQRAPNAFSPLYEYLDLPLSELSLPFQYTLNSPQRSTLANLAGYLDAAGLSCAIADNIFRDEGQAKRFEALLASRPGVVGISASSLHRTESVAAIAATVRRLSPGSVVALGGCGVNFNPAMASSADVVVRGDGELSLAELARAVRDGAAAADLPRLFPSCEKSGGGPVYTGGRRDLSLDYLPAWQLYGKPASDCFPVEASKGCRHSCVFCSYPERGSQDYRSVESVIKELRFLSDVMGAKAVRFVDTNLTSDHGYVEELCRRMKAERFNLPWSCFARADELAARPELCGRMADAGCFWVYAGVESADAGILSAMGKGFGPEQVYSGARNVKSAGMAMHANFVIGFPGETQATLQSVFEMITGSGMDTVSFTALGLTDALSELARGAPEKFGGLARDGGHWAHSTMDFKGARRAAGELVRKVAAADGAPLIASHGIGMYYLLGGGLDFSGVLAYFAAVRDFHRAKAAGLGAEAAAQAAAIRSAYERTAVRFGWTGKAAGR